MRIYNNQILDVDASDVVNGTVLIPQNIRSIGHRAFICLPNSIFKIEDYAFRNCTALERLTIPDAIFSISKKQFENCKKLKLKFHNHLYSYADLECYKELF